MEEEFSDLQKFLNILALKVASLVAHFRSESTEKILIPCNPSPANADWFGLAVRDHSALRVEIKELTKNCRLIIDQPFVIEVAASSPNADIIPLEFWWLWFDPEVIDKDVQVKYVVYNRMAILLKSVIVALRASPMNRLTHQGDHFKISCKVSVGQPDVSILKSVGRRLKVGPLKSPYGSIYFSGVCRDSVFFDHHSVSTPTLKAFQPNHSFANRVHQDPVISPTEKFRSDHAVSETRPKTLHIVDKPLSFAQLHCVGAFADPTKSSSESDDDSYEIPDSAFANLVPPVDDEKEMPCIQPKGRTESLKSILKDVGQTVFDVGSPKARKACINSAVQSISRCSDESFVGEDDLSSERLCPAFAPANGKSNAVAHDLAHFFQECQLAPHQLTSLEKKNEKVSQTMSALSENLGGMEEQLAEFDRFVADLRQVGGESSWIMTLSGH